MTKWINRFREALELLCGEKPPIEAVWAWYDKDRDSFALQNWATDNRKLWWVQGIALIDAAKVLADQPREGEGHADRGVSDFIHESVD